MKTKKLILTLGKFILMAAGVIFIIQAGLQLLRMNGANADIPFKISQVQRTDFEKTVSSTGTMEAVGTVDVGTQTSGTIAKVLVDYNSKVKKGQILAQLDQSLFVTDVNNSKAALMKAQAGLKNAQAFYDRDKKLFKNGHISQEQFLDSQTTYNEAQADVLSAQAVLTKAQVNLDYTIIRSPIDGTVIEKSIDEGQTVAASYSTPTLFTIAEDLSLMQIAADVDESDIGLIKTGQAVRFTVQAYPDINFDGVVSQIRLNPETISNVVTYTVIVTANNFDHLIMPGMTATADFVVDSEKNVLTVTSAALQFRPDGAKSPKGEDVLYVLGSDKKLKPMIVKKGKSENGVTIITQGICEGDRVITGIEQESKKEQTGLFSMFTKGGKSRKGNRPF
ncbi:MAG: efflux RND transporter periplasmic adaptor subunit [Desulfobacteraceae bacterium]|nr:efflux RND transporter periplasmic adaptor subunit [Desulfobacteraceae bacterium]